MGTITTAVTTFFRDAQRAIAEMRQSFEDDFLAESSEMRIGRGRFKDGIVVVSPNELNDRHGTGVILARCFGGMPNVLSIRSRDLHGDHGVGHESIRFSHRGRTRGESYIALSKCLEGNTFRYVICVPYHPDELLSAVILKDVFQARLCVYVMDDNHLVSGEIPRELMREALEKSDLRLAISPEMRDAYESAFRLKFWLRPPVVTPESISTRPAVPSDEILASKRGLVVGNLWSNQILELLAETVARAQLDVDWFGNNKSPWLTYDVNALRAKGVVPRGFIAEKDLANKLNEYAFAIVPSGTLGSDDARADIARYSLPTRMPFLMAAGNMPTIVLGSRQTAAAGFVERFQLGAVMDYDGPRLRSAVERICSRAVQSDIRERAARLGRYFSAQGVGEWILRSINEGHAVSNEIEELLPRRHGDYAVYLAPRVPAEIYPDFAPVFLSLSRLKSRGLTPDFIVDVGASTGIWSMTVQKVFSNSRYLLVEPLARLYEEKHLWLKKHYAKFELVRCAISDRSGEATFQVSSDLYGSSLLTPADQREYQSVTVQVKTLDQLQQELSITGRGMIKLDIQLAEHLAIAGGRNLLQSVDVVVAELTLPRLAKGAKTFSEMLQLMSDIGFRYYDDVGEWRCPMEGTLLQKDVIFVRRQMFRYEGALD